MLKVKYDTIHPVILSGGAGSRLWPLSRRLFPKQLLPLAGPRTMLQSTLERVAGLAFAPITIICNQEHRFLIAEQLADSEAEINGMILEPEGRNTAPAAIIAALLFAEGDPDALILLMPSDHIVLDLPAFEDAVSYASAAARAGSLVTFGVKPASPETGYGYICRGNPIDSAPGAFHVKRFVEKPDLITAQAYIDSGDYFWNSGMFLFSASALLRDAERLEPAMFAACRNAIATGRDDMGFFRLGEAAFSASPSRSIDYAIMEKTQAAAMVPVDMAWNDVGSWRSLWDIADKDGSGNAVSGDVLSEGSRDSYLRSEGPLLAAVGIDNLIVVATSDAVLVAHRDSAQDVKKIVEGLEREGRNHHVHHRQVFRPWGSYESIDQGERFQVKRIVVKPGAKLSLQKHHHRAEHWVVVSGTAKVTRGDQEFLLHENESTFIPLGTTHRLENPGKIPLHLIEVQSGSYLGEDDIVRFEDTYGRAGGEGTESIG
jgi:mannose-1-phosphate guanylyltransferase/mannose-6-phosphate isomerase